MASSMKAAWCAARPDRPLRVVSYQLSAKILNDNGRTSKDGEIGINGPSARSSRRRSPTQDAP